MADAAEETALWERDDTEDMDPPKVLRASAGQWFRVPLRSAPNLAETVQHQKQQGAQVIATSPAADCTYWDLDWRSPTLILLGNEGAGLSPKLSTLADRAVRIPQSPDVDSLNVAMSAALLLYEAQRQCGTNPLRD